MRWRTFLIYNAAGGILWATLFGLVGYFAGRYLHENFAQVERLAGRVGLIGAILIVVVVALFIIYRLRRARRARTVATTNASKPE